jgi:hypothetical protein
MFIGRRQDGSIFGASTVPQEWTTEEMPDDHPDVVAFTGRMVAELTSEQKLARIGLTVEDLKALIKS